MASRAWRLAFLLFLRGETAGSCVKMHARRRVMSVFVGGRFGRSVDPVRYGFDFLLRDFLFRGRQARAGISSRGMACGAWDFALLLCFAGKSSGSWVEMHARRRRVGAFLFALALRGSRLLSVCSQFSQHQRPSRAIGLVRQSSGI